MEAKEGNKIIAEFLEYKQCGRKEWEYAYWMIEGKSYREDELKYHSSWDWLMPVVEKIEGIELPGHGKFLVIISGNGCTIQGSHFNPENDFNVYFSDIYDTDKITSAWVCIIRFIQWYNKQLSNGK